MTKPADPLDPFDFRQKVHDLEADLSFDKRLFAHFGDGERYFRIVGVELDSDGDMIVQVDPLA